MLIKEKEEREKEHRSWSCRCQWCRCSPPQSGARENEEDEGSVLLLQLAHRHALKSSITHMRWKMKVKEEEERKGIRRRWKMEKP